MSKQVTNSDLMGVLGNIREDIGALKESSKLYLKGLENHAERISKIEKSQARQKGFITGIAALGSAVGAAAGVVVHKLLNQ